MKHRLIYEQGPYRIIEIPDEMSIMDDLKGDSFNPKIVTDIEPDVLKRDELRFERNVENDGVWGYILEKWNPEIGIGWSQVDACFGFVGQYVEKAESYEHYIVEEMKQTILKMAVSSEQSK